MASSSGDDSVSLDGSDVYEVEAILEHRVIAHKLQYKVRKAAMIAALTPLLRPRLLAVLRDGIREEVECLCLD